MLSELEIGQIISASFLALGFGAQIGGAVILRCINDKDQWCSELIEVDGIVAIIFGMVFLLVFSMVSTMEHELGSLFARCFVNQKSRRRSTWSRKIGSNWPIFLPTLSITEN